MVYRYAETKNKGKVLENQSERKMHCYLSYLLVFVLFYWNIARYVSISLFTINFNFLLHCFIGIDLTIFNVQTLLLS